MVVSVVTSDILENSTTTIKFDTTTENLEKIVANSSSRQSRAYNNVLYIDLIACAMKPDVSCLVDTAENYLAIKKNEILGELFLII